MTTRNTVLNTVTLDNGVTISETQNGNEYNYTTSVHPNIVHTITDVEEGGMCYEKEGNIASLTSISTSTVQQIKKAVKKLADNRCKLISEKYAETY